MLIIIILKKIDANEPKIGLDRHYDHMVKIYRHQIDEL